MSRRFTLVSIALVAVVAFLVGVIVAGGLTRSAISAGTPPNAAAGEHMIGPASVAAGPGPLVNFADIVERVNATVVNIDATSRGVERRRRTPGLAPEPPDLFSDPPGAPGAPRRGAGSGFII